MRLFLLIAAFVSGWIVFHSCNSHAQTPQEKRVEQAQEEPTPEPTVEPTPEPTETPYAIRKITYYPENAKVYYESSEGENGEKENGCYSFVQLNGPSVTLCGPMKMEDLRKQGQ